jgi:hypothetical protein
MTRQRIRSPPLSVSQYAMLQEMTFVRARRRLKIDSATVSTRIQSISHPTKGLLRQTKLSLVEKYLQNIDGSNPSKKRVAAFVEASLFESEARCSSSTSDAGTFFMTGIEKYE